MIAIFMNTMEDTNTFAPLFEGLDCGVLVNPTRAEVIEVLEQNPTETLLCLGHGSPRGLFASDWQGYVIDSSMSYLLKDREMIGIWCYASDFARMNNLKGFFTYMFISNANEASIHHCGEVTDELIYEENLKFSNAINTFIKEGKPMEEWVETLYESCNSDLPFVEFNYSNLAYFDGENNYCPKYLLEEEETYQPTLWDDVDDYYFPTDYDSESAFYFARINKVEDFLYEKNGMNETIDVEMLTDEEFMLLSEYQYTTNEYVFAFNNGTIPSQSEFYIRYI